MRAAMWLFLIGCADSAMDAEIVLENSAGKADGVAASLALTAERPDGSVVFQCDNRWFACQATITVTIDEADGYLDAMRWISGGDLASWLPSPDGRSRSRLPVGQIELRSSRDAPAQPVVFGIALRSLTPLTVEAEETFELDVPAGSWAKLTLHRNELAAPSQYIPSVLALDVAAAW